LARPDCNNSTNRSSKGHAATKRFPIIKILICLCILVGLPYKYNNIQPYSNKTLFKYEDHTAALPRHWRDSIGLCGMTSEPLQCAVFGTSFIFDLWSRRWSVARLLNLATTLEGLGSTSIKLLTVPTFRPLSVALLFPLSPEWLAEMAERLTEGPYSPVHSIVC